MLGSLQPTPGTGRIESLDVLRGFALLGILTINVGAFSMPSAAYFDPTAYGDLTGLNGWWWRVSHVLADLKFMAIFSMLFGAGIVLMAERAEAARRSAAALHYRRMAWLIGFGLLHGYLLWYADILYWYGMCGLVVFLFRRLSPPWLIVLGLLSMGVSSALLAVSGLTFEHWPQGAQNFVAESLRPAPETLSGEVAAYRGGWLEQMAVRVPQAMEMQTGSFVSWALWRVSGLMLLGMGLFKLGVLTGQKSRRFYIGTIAVALLIAIPIVVYGVHRNFAAGWPVPEYFFLGLQYNYWASVLVSLGWIGVVMLAVRSARWQGLNRRLAAVGRTAFSNYILQTVICTLIFYGHGFGLFGQIERVGQAAIMVAIWAVQLAISPWWLRRFHYGPLEWLWRSLTYMKWQPLVRRAPL